eukprot:205206-Pelagomonas_calceolata.AAC.6
MNKVQVGVHVGAASPAALLMGCVLQEVAYIEQDCVLQTWAVCPLLCLNIYTWHGMSHLAWHGTLGTLGTLGMAWHGTLGMAWGKHMNQLQK